MLSVWRTVFPSDWANKSMIDIEAWRERTPSLIGYYWVIEGNVVACATVDNRTLRNLAVCPEWQRQGIGRRFLGKLIDQHGQLQLECDATVLGFYIHCGLTIATRDEVDGMWHMVLSQRGMITDDGEQVDIRNNFIGRVQ